MLYTTYEEWLEAKRKILIQFSNIPELASIFLNITQQQCFSVIDKTRKMHHTSYSYDLAYIIAKSLPFETEII